MENTVKTQSTIPKLKFKNVIGYGCGDAGGVITIYMAVSYTHLDVYKRQS